MTLEGTVVNGVIVLDQPGKLQEGTRVQVLAEEVKKPTLRECLLKLAGTVDDLPPDMARNHDQYIHGSPQAITFASRSDKEWSPTDCISERPGVSGSYTIGLIFAWKNRRIS